MQDQKVFKEQRATEWTNRSRTLIVFSKGCTSKQKRIILQIFSMLPHSKKQFRLDKRETGQQVRELCQMHKCKQFLYFQTRKKINFFLYAGIYPQGPTIKLEIQDYVDSSSLKLQGNCIKGSRPIISFDKQFDQIPVLQVLKSVFQLSFNVPHLHPKSKPCFDHVFSFSSADNRIYFRNYQIFKEMVNKKIDVKQLYQIGPRLVLKPLAVLDGAIKGTSFFRQARQKKVMKKMRKKRQRFQGQQEQQDIDF